ALAGAFVWLGDSLTGAPMLAGAPLGAVHLNRTETTNVTRGGVTMRSVSSGIPASNSGFASVPSMQFDNSFQGVRFELPAGNWEFAFLAASEFGSTSGNVIIRDLTAGVDRQTIAVSGSGALLINTANTAYTNASTALADAINAPLPYVAVTVADAGGGTGVIQFYATGSINIAGIALRQV
ncbi:MAG: hypothetical protein ACRC14_15185, partial [Paracoccaceae bacterium]